METLSAHSHRILRFDEFRVTVFVVLAHFIVMLVHGMAHAQLAIALPVWGNLFIAAFVGIGPIVGLGLTWVGRRRQGAAMLGLTMAGAFVFGLWNHFVVPGADHVSHVPAVGWKLPFQVTAWLLAITEAGGAVLGLVCWLAEPIARDRAADHRRSGFPHQ